jgi:flavin-binding protein dodecin
MKKLYSLILVLVLVGCSTTSWQDAAGKVLATTALTVDATMKGWAYHVVNDSVPQNQQDSVKIAYAKYQLAMEAAKSAYVSAVTVKDSSVFEQAKQALLASSSALTQLIKSFNPTNP